MSTASQKRQQRAAAARVLLSLHAKDNLDNPSTWTWESLDRLPAWCLASSEERIELQLTCGAMYLSPDIRFWITRPALSAVQSLIGKSVFERIVSQADTMQLPRESVSDIVAKAGLDPATASVEGIRDLLMAAGSSVLNATVHDSLPGEMLTASLGPAIGDVTGESATLLMNAAQTLRLELTSGEEVAH